MTENEQLKYGGWLRNEKGTVVKPNQDNQMQMGSEQTREYKLERRENGRG